MAHDILVTSKIPTMDFTLGDLRLELEPGILIQDSSFNVSKNSQCNATSQKFAIA